MLVKVVSAVCVWTIDRLEQWSCWSPIQVFCFGFPLYLAHLLATALKQVNRKESRADSYTGAEEKEGNKHSETAGAPFFLSAQHSGCKSQRIIQGRQLRGCRSQTVQLLSALIRFNKDLRPSMW